MIDEKTTQKKLLDLKLHIPTQLPKDVEVRMVGYNPTSFLNGLCYGLELACEIVGNQPKLGELIPCSDRLPKESGKYLVTDYKKCWMCEFIQIGSLRGWADSVRNPQVKAWLDIENLVKEIVESV